MTGITVVQAVSSADLSNNATCAGLTQGNMLLLIAGQYSTGGPNTPPVTYFVGGTSYTTPAAFLSRSSATNISYAMWLVPVTAAMAGATALSFTVTSAGAVKLYGMELSAAGTIIVDQAHAANGSGSTFDSGSVTAQFDNELAVFSIPVFNFTASPGAVPHPPWTEVGGSNFMQTWYQNGVASGTALDLSGSLTGSGDWASGLITLIAGTDYTLFGQPALGGTVTADNAAYTLGTEFEVALGGGQASQLDGVWFYSAPSAQDLPDWIGSAFWNGSSFTAGASQASPAWSGAVASGWVFAPFTSPPVLSGSGNYLALASFAGGGDWYLGTSHYYDTGAGSAGVTDGPLSAPNTGASKIGQGNFTTAHDGIPNSTFQATNYWVDPKVSVFGSGGATVSGAAALTAPGSLAASAVVTEPGAAALTAPGSLAASAVLTRRGAAALTAPGSLAGAGVVSKTGQAHLSAAPALAAAATLTRKGQAPLAAPGSLTAVAHLTKAGQAHLLAIPVLTASSFAGVIISGSAALSASPALRCSPLSQRIRITPGNVPYGTVVTSGPVVSDPYVTVPGVEDGIYDA